jgi:hypothetical protein
MENPKHWNDEPVVFEAVATAMQCDETEDIQRVRVSEEKDGYGSRGIITFKTRDGRRWKLLLAELT